LIWLMSLLLCFATAKPAKSKAPKPAKAPGPVVQMTKVSSCKVPEGENPNPKKVLVIKQWHLAPTTVTKGFKEKYAQEKNQTDIYKKLSAAVKSNRLDMVAAEGCEGEINNEFTTAFNGWKLDELKKQAQTKNYERILSHVPLKLEARWGDKLLTVCGDDEKLIQEGNLRLSNLRGWMGFWSRLTGDIKPSEERLALYAETAADLLKVPKNTPVPELKAKIRERSLEELDLFLQSLHKRNDSFVKTLSEREFKTAAVVIGGLHADDLRLKLEAAGLPCEVYEPAGYSKMDENLIQDFKKALLR